MVNPSARAAERLLALLVCALLLATPAWAGAEGSLRVSGSTALDSNARRDLLQVGPESDLVASALVAARGQLTGEGFVALGRYDLGARKFLRITSEDALVQSLRLETTMPLGSALRLGLLGQGKDRRGERSYTDLLGGAVVEYVPDPRVDLRLEARVHRFIFWPASEYSFAAPEVSLSARYRFDRRHSAVAFGEVGPRRFSSDARDIPEVVPPRALGRRADTFVAAGAGYAFRGPFSLAADYSFLAQDSNSFGESLHRHRLSITGAVRLPWRLILLGELAFQITRYPHGVYLSERFTLQQDDESFNQVSLRLARPLTEKLDLELSYALFHTQLPANGLTYLRQVGGLGLALRL